MHRVIPLIASNGELHLDGTYAFARTRISTLGAKT
jgi:hypothetical protein